MTRAEIRTRILNALNDSPTSPVFWSLEEINAIIDEAGEVLAEELSAIKRTRLQAIEPGATYYYTQAIARDMMAPYRIWLPHLNRKLTAVTQLQLDDRNRTWLTVTGDPQCWFSVSWDLFGVYPKAAAGGGLLQVDYLAWPRSLQDDSDEPEFSEADHDAHILYGVYDGFLKQWDFQRALVAFSQFVALIPDGKARGLAELNGARLEAGIGSSLKSGVTL